ncbi:MAG: YigZ family protein [Desulfovibrionaceae bacterium]
MTDRYPIPHLPPQALHRTEQIIKRSRFITSTAHAPSSEAARAFVERIRQEFPDATHNCWAFAAGAPGHTARVGFSDDGEPHGTAGRPMLTVLLHGGVGEIVSVVTRYFGGIKLGTGGLVRAYQGAVQENMDTLPTRERIIPAHLDVILEYAFIERFRRLLPAHEAVVTAEEFGTDAVFSVSLPQEHASAFALALAELTDGGALVESRDAET